MKTGREREICNQLSQPSPSLYWALRLPLYPARCITDCYYNIGFWWASEINYVRIERHLANHKFYKVVNYTLLMHFYFPHRSRCVNILVTRAVLICLATFTPFLSLCECVCVCVLFYICECVDWFVCTPVCVFGCVCMCVSALIGCLMKWLFGWKIVSLIKMRTY